MKINNLTIGMVIKNYKCMCEVLELEVKTGQAKQNQLKWFAEYFRFSKDGNKFIIEEIYDKEIFEMVDNRGKSEGSRNNNIAEYIKNIETLILDLLSQSKQGYGKAFLSKNALLKELKMINKNYSYCKQRIPKLSKFMNIDKAIVEEWYDSVSNTLEKNLETALKSLESQSLILWSREITVVKVIPISDITKEDNIIKTKKIDEWDEEVIRYKVNDNTMLSHKEGTEEEKKFIIHTEREILKEMQCRNKAIVIAMGMWDTFMDKVNNIILKEYNIAYYYKSYKILFNEDHIYEVIEDLCDFQIDKDDKKHEQNILNKGVNNRIHSNVIKRQDKAQKEANKVKFGVTNDVKVLRRIAKNYVEDNDMLNSNLIEISCMDIRKKVKQLKLK